MGAARPKPTRPAMGVRQQRSLTSPHSRVAPEKSRYATTRRCAQSGPQEMHTVCGAVVPGRRSRKPRRFHRNVVEEPRDGGERERRLPQTQPRYETVIHGSDVVQDPRARHAHARCPNGGPGIGTYTDVQGLPPLVSQKILACERRRFGSRFVAACPRSGMPWIGVSLRNGRPTHRAVPWAGLIRARRHRLDVNDPRHQGWLFPGGELTIRFAAVTHRSILHEVDVTYICLAVPQVRGDPFRFAKYYYSTDDEYQWLNLSWSPYEAASWSPSPCEFYAWPENVADENVEDVMDYSFTQYS